MYITSNAVKTVNQNLTQDQKKIARNNIGAAEAVNADWDVSNTTSQAYIKNKPTIPTRTSQLTENDDYTVKDANYDDRTFATKTEKEEKYKAIDDHTKAIGKIQQKDIDQDKEIAALKVKSQWIGSIDSFNWTDEKPKTQTNINKILNQAVDDKLRIKDDDPDTPIPPAEGYQISVLDESAVYQYSESSSNWEIFVTNQTIANTTETTAGVVKVGDGLSIDASGVLSANADDLDLAKDWNENNYLDSAYIKNRTHFTLGNDSTYTIDKSWFDYDKRLAVGDLYHYATHPTLEDTYFCWIKIAENFYTLEELRDSNISFHTTPNYSDQGSVFPEVDFIFKDATYEEYAPSSGKSYIAQMNNEKVLIVFETTTFGNSIVPQGIYLDITTTTSDHGASKGKMVFTSLIDTITWDIDKIQKLDVKYLPDTDDTHTQQWVKDALGDIYLDTEQSDWNEVDPNDNGYIKNKPFGTLPIINAYYDGSVLKEPYMLVDNGQTFYWASDEVAPFATVTENLSTVKVKISNGEDYYTDLAEYAGIGSDGNAYRYTLLVGTITYHVAIVDDDVYDSTGTIKLKRGVYIGAKRANGVHIDRIYSETTYTKEDEAIWKGTQAEYEANRSKIADGTTIYITDDVEDPKTHVINGKEVDVVDVYAPTTSGTSNQMLVANSGKAPTWATRPYGRYYRIYLTE